MKRAKILTHGGRAHRDDYMACCLAVFLCHQRGHQAFVERRLVTASDLEDPKVWVIDTGGDFNPHLLNFDHHQDQEAVRGLCALDLVIRHAFGDAPYQAFRTCNPWMTTTAIHDTQGAAAAANWARADMKAYNAMRSPLEKVALSMFSEVAVVYPHSMMHAHMLETGRLLWGEIEEVRKFQNFDVNELPSVSEHAGLRVWDVRKVDTHDSTMRLTMLNHEAIKRSVDITIGINGRDGQISLHRQHKAEGAVDLAKLAGMRGVRFAHKNGFYAVVGAEVADDEILGLLSHAIANSPR